MSRGEGSQKLTQNIENVKKRVQNLILNGEFKDQKCQRMVNDIKKRKLNKFVKKISEFRRIFRIDRNLNFKS